MWDTFKHTLFDVCHLHVLAAQPIYREPPAKNTDLIEGPAGNSHNNRHCKSFCFIIRKDGEGPISKSVKEKIKTGQITGEDKKKLYQLFQETKERLIKDAEKNKEARKEAFNRVCQRKYEQFVKTAKLRHMEQRIGKAFAKPPTASELTPAAGQGDTTGSAGVDRATAEDKPRSERGEGTLVTPTELKRLTKLRKHRDNQDEMSEKEWSEPGEVERKHYYNLRSHRVQLGEVTSPTQSDNGTQSQGRRHNRRRGDSAAAVARLRRMGRDSEGAILPPLAGPGGME